jgi:hypothetical protein
MNRHGPQVPLCPSHLTVSLSHTVWPSCNELTTTQGESADGAAAEGTEGMEDAVDADEIGGCCDCSSFFE